MLILGKWQPRRRALDGDRQMGNKLDMDLRLSPPGAPRRTQGEVLRDIKLALATGSNVRQPGFDPYDSRLGRAPRDVWGRKTP